MTGSVDDRLLDIDEKLQNWIIAMFRELGLGQPTFEVAAGAGGPPDDSDPKDETEEDDALGPRREALTLRIEGIPLPDRMPSEETARFEIQIAKILSLVKAAGANADLDRVEKAINKLEVIAAGLAETMARRLARAAKLSQVLAGLVAPDAALLSDAETPNFDGARAAIARDLSGSIGDTSLTNAEAALRELVGKLNIAKVLAKGRADRAGLVMAGFGAVERAPGGQDVDYLAYDAEVPTIMAVQASGLNDVVLAAAEAALARLKAEAGRLAALFADRIRRADAIRASMPTAAPDGVNPQENGQVTDAEQRVTDILAMPLDETVLTQAEAVLKIRDDLLVQITAAVKERIKQRETISAALLKLDFSGLSAAEGLVGLQEEQTAIEMALPLALTTPELEALAEQATDLARRGNAAREKLAAEILVKVSVLTVPGGLPVAEAEPLTARIEAIKKAVEPPAEGAAIIEAVKGLAVLPDLLKAAKDAIDDRKARRKAAIAEAGKLIDPKELNAAEKVELDDLRKIKALIEDPAELTEEATKATIEAGENLAKKHAELVVNIKAREDRRTEVLKSLQSLVPPISATGAEILKVLKEGGALRAVVQAADTVEKIEAEVAKIAALAKEVKAIEDLAAARDKANKAHAVAEAYVTSERGDLFAGAYQKARKMLVDTGALLDAAKSVSDCQAAEVEIAKIAPYIQSVTAYRATLNTWRVEAEFHINMMQTKSTNSDSAIRKKEENVYAAQKAAMKTLMHKLAAAADALAANTRLVDAKAELDKFETEVAPYIDPNDNSAKTATFVAVTDPDAIAFPGVIATFVNDKYPIIDQAAQHSVIKVNVLKGSYGGSRSKGFNQQKWTEATAEIANLSTLLDQCKAFIDVYSVYEAVLKAAVPTDPLGVAYAGIVSDCSSKNFVAAKQKVVDLDSLNGGADKKNAIYTTKRNDLEEQTNDVLSVLTGGAGDSVSVPWAAAETEPDHAKKLQKLDEVEAALPACEALVAAKRSAISALGSKDPGKYKILKAADDLLAASDVGGATAAYKQAELDAANLAQYLELVGRVTKIKDSYPSGAGDAIKVATDALGAAELKAVGGLLVEAQSMLTAILSSPEVALIDKEMSLYETSKKSTMALHNRLLTVMTHNAAKDKLTTPWALIEETGDVDKNYLDAIALINVHNSVLELAKPYVEARIRAIKALSALNKIADKVSSTQKALIYAMPLDKSKLDGDLLAAERLAGAGEFLSATKAFDDLVTLAKDRMKIAANSLEEVDHGHFLAGHGPDVPREETLARMTTGIRPDGEYAPARNSSQFLDIGNFMACYELAWEHALATVANFGGTTITSGDMRQASDTIDVGKPVGMGVEGLTKQTGFAKGVSGETDLFDTYEVTEGLDKLQYKFMFHFDHPGGLDKVLTKIGDFEKAYKAANGGTSFTGTDYPGHWAVNQLLPSGV